MQEVINLSKGQTIDLRKNSKGESVYDLSQVTIGLGWDVRQKESGFLENYLAETKKKNTTLDAIAFLLDSNGKVANLGRICHFQTIN
jgi:tellurium resistance protein TerD